MNIYNYNDNEFKNTDIYKNFIKDNPSFGSLRIRAFAASGAIPISGLKIIISTNYNENEIIFFNGVTDESGTIPKIKLPAPTLNTDNLDVPNKTTYKITATYKVDNTTQTFSVNMYEGICVVQNISIVPSNIVGDFIGY